MNMIVALCTFLAISAVSTQGQDYEDSALISPCPDVFMYEPPKPDDCQWYGVINVTTENQDQLRLDVLLDDKADVLGSWIGEVTTLDNMNYTIVTDVQNKSTPVVEVRFFVKYKHLKRAPRLEAISLNGREICSSLRNLDTKVRCPPVNRFPAFDDADDDFFASRFPKFPDYEDLERQDPPRSPCPDVFTYEPSVPDSDRWYGIINMTTRHNHSLQLDIVLDDKADMLGNWIGEVSTIDNMNYTITADLQNSSIAVTEVRFFVKYNRTKIMPRLVAIRLNGRDICSKKSDPGSNGTDIICTNIQFNDSAQKVPNITNRFIDIALGILQDENWGFGDLQEHVAPNPNDEDTKHSGTTTKLSRSTITPKTASDRKTVDTEDQMSKPVDDILVQLHPLQQKMLQSKQPLIF